MCVGSETYFSASEIQSTLAIELKSVCLEIEYILGFVLYNSV